MVSRKLFRVERVLFRLFEISTFCFFIIFSFIVNRLFMSNIFLNILLYYILPLYFLASREAFDTYLANWGGTLPKLLGGCYLP